jgi:hypothetical protein
MQILLVGLGPELDRLERVQQVQRLEDVLPALERQAREVADLISQRGCGSVLGAAAGRADQRPTGIHGRGRAARRHPSGPLAPGR